MELQILHWFESLHNGILDPIMVIITKLGDKGIFWILLALILICIPKYRKVGVMVTVALILSLIFCNGIMKNLFTRPRPFWLDDTFQLLVEAPKDFSFPSGHTSASFAAAMSIFCWNKKAGILPLILASLISLSRLYLCVHFPTDVLASLILGSLYGVLGYFIVIFACKHSKLINRLLSVKDAKE